MAYVTVPKDLTKVKNKVTFNLTKRHATGMVLLMVPAFLFGMYEKDGMPLEKILLNIITVRFRRPHVRRYETENIYMQEEKTEEKGTHKTSARHKGVRLRNA